MFPIIIRYGVIGGLVVALPMIGLMVFAGPNTFFAGGMLYGYTSMILALIAVFMGIKHYRDKALGGAIKFGTALLLGLSISAVASTLYAIGWEISLAATGLDFPTAYYKPMLDAAVARQASPEELQALEAQADSFATMYRNPVYRIPMTFVEMFPVGILVSLVSAGLLRNSRLLPARA